MTTWSKKLPPMSPFLMSTEQESSSKPRFQVNVFLGFADENITAQDCLNVLRMVKPDLISI
jgi:hypothetical protein